MPSIVDVTRALKSVRTVGQARTVIGEAIEGIKAALDLVPPSTGDLRQSRANLQAWLKELSSLSASAPVPGFQARSQTIVRAWVNVAGAGGEVAALQTVSLLDELKQSAADLPKDVFAPVGRALGEVAKGVGEAGGGLLGGLLKGLGPLVVLVLALVIYLKIFRKA
jgi:hypothetical protein